MRRILLVPLALAGCVPQPEAPAPAPPPVVAPPPPRPAAPALGPDWRDWPVSAGTWTYRQDARGSIALFGTGGSDASLTLRCDREGSRIYLSRAGAAATSATIRTSTTTRAVPMQPTGGTPAYVAAALAPADPLLDAMAFSRGHFTVEQAGTPPLVIPAWAEVGRVIEDCRGG
jgi:hypothetical protein